MNSRKFVSGLGVALLAAMGGLVQAAGAQLDRAQLIKLADDYVAAMAAHDATKVPLAANVKVVENVKRISTRDGLWRTATSGTKGFRIVVPDPVSQQVVGMVVLDSSGKPVQLGYRLRVVDGKITEAEHIVQGKRDGSALGANLEVARPGFAMEVPYDYADSRGRLIWIGKSYYDALDNNNGSLTPFAADCQRHENGMRTAPNGGPNFGGGGPPGAAPAAPGLVGMQDCTSQINSGTFDYITRIENRRVEVADTVTGLVAGFSHFRHAMEKKVFPIYGNPGRRDTGTMLANTQPFDMPALHIYKVWGGRIHEIEAVGVLDVPYNAPTGWE
jgi:hypothetical protein